MALERPFLEPDRVLAYPIAIPAPFGKPDFWTLRAAENDAFAQWVLANQYLLEGPVQAEAARSLLQQSAEGGLTHAAAQWGQMLFHGAEGLPRDTASGRAWIERAALRGHAEAAYALARIDWEGRDGTGDKSRALVSLRRSAELGWGRAAETLGTMLRQGTGIERDAVEARGWLERAARQGRPGAKLELAEMLRRGEGGARDDARALRLVEEVAARGVQAAQRMRAEMKAAGLGTAPDPSVLRAFLEHAAQGGDASAAYELGQGLVEGRFGLVDEIAGIPWLERAALADHPLAQFQLAWLGRASDKRAQWLARSAALGYTPAEFYYGMALAYGQGVPADDGKAIEWYRRAADKGYMEAQSSLAWRYLQGATLPLNETAGLEWSRKAAEQGHELAMTNLARRLMARGDAAGREEALKWVERLAMRGNALYQNSLGSIRSGHTPEFGARQRNYAEALRWWHQAAAQGYAAAELNIGDAYLHGWGKPADAKQARHWYERAAARGEPDGDFKLAELFRLGAKGVKRDETRSRLHLMLAIQGGSQAARQQAAKWEQPGHPWRSAGGGYDWARIRQDAKAGEADAQMLLGAAYLQGVSDIPQSLPNAYFWFQKAAAQGNIEAMNYVGRALYLGGRDPTAKKSARDWFEKAARGGRVDAMVSLARMNALGEAGKADPKRALSLLREAARLNHPQGIRELARAYERGELGLKASAEQAAEWLARLPPERVPDTAQQGKVHDAARSEMAQYFREAWRGVSVRFAEIGMNHELGRGVPMDIREAVSWYQRGVAANESRAQFRLARLYQSGSDALPRNIEQATTLFRLAAKQGHPEAQLALATILSNGQPGAQVQAEAMKWLEQAAARGSPEALHRLGFHYLHGRGVRAQPERAVALCRQAAEKGYDQAQFDLAGFYVRGVGVARDEVEAAVWYERAAEQGHATAALALARLILQQAGDAIAASRAEPWLMRAAQLSNADAQYELAQFYLQGPAGKADEARALHWTETAARQGHTNAMLALAGLCELGKVPGKGKECALPLYEAVAENGHLDTQLMLGSRALKAEASPRDPVRAMYWFGKAAEQGDVWANFLVGTAYLGGEGVPKDDTRALQYLHVSAEQNEPLAQWLYGSTLADRAHSLDDLRTAVSWLERANKHGLAYAQEKITAVCTREPRACVP